MDRRSFFGRVATVAAVGAEAAAAAPKETRSVTRAKASYPRT